MNGFKLLKYSDIEALLTSLDSSEYYDEDEFVCLDVPDSSLTFSFKKPMDAPNRVVLKELLRDLIEMDEFVAGKLFNSKHYENTGNCYELAIAEFTSLDAVMLFYCGVNVNTQWGAEFVRSSQGKWEFNRLC